MIHSIIDSRIPQPTVTNQVLVWNNTTNLFDASLSLSGLTLNSPVIAGNFSWTGSVWDCSNSGKRVDFDPNTTFTFRATSNYLVLDPNANSVEFGNPTTNPTFDSLGTGLASFGGNIDVTGKILANGGFIGDSGDDELIEIDGAGGIVTVDGLLGVGKTPTANTVLDVLGAVVSGSVGQLINLVSGQGDDVLSGSNVTGKDGGALFLFSGDGGIGADGSSRSTGGDGGGYALFAGNGGEAKSVGNRRATGGAGGSLNIKSGDGGISQTANTADNNGGNAGTLSISGGAGNNATAGATNNGGDGGSVIINGGSAGTGSTSNGTDGNIVLGGTTGNVRIGDMTAPNHKLEVKADSIVVVDSQSPASNGTGTQGEIAWDADYIYVCTATNTWKRAALTGGY